MSKTVVTTVTKYECDRCKYAIINDVVSHGNDLPIGWSRFYISCNSPYDRGTVTDSVLLCPVCTAWMTPILPWRDNG